VLAALAMALGCGRCGSTPAAGTSGTAPAAAGEASGAPTANAAAAAALPVADVPEVRDTGDGRATAALRAVLQAYGIGFDADRLLKECNVDDEGASIDDLEDVAVKYGLEAGSVIVPVEHVLAGVRGMLPAIVVVDSADDEQDFVVAWRLEGNMVEVMDPREGRKWVGRGELSKVLHVHEMSMPADELREAMAAKAFGEALAVRMMALGAGDKGTSARVDERVAADPGWRALAALDASIRKLEGEPARPAQGQRLLATFACAFEKKCEGTEPVPAALWWAQPAPNGPQGEAQVRVRGAVLLAIEGRSAPAAPEDPPKPSAEPQAP
jgi:predicted double-glycine peptidase